MKRYFILLLLLCIIVMPVIASGGNENPLIRRGNQKYAERNFAEAEIAYRRSIEMNSQNATALYNLGNSLYRQGRYEEAADLFDALAQTAPSGFDHASAYHNLGNAHLGNNNIKGSIDAYKQALRLNPADDETRYNLAYALKKLEEDPSEDQQQGDTNHDDKQDQEQGDDQQDKDQQQGDDQNQQDQEQGDENQQQNQQPAEQDDREEQAQPRPDQISQQDAERILNALNQKEQKIQEQLNNQNAQTKSSKAEKAW